MSVEAMNSARSPLWLRALPAVVLVVLTFGLAALETRWVVLWPSLVALILVFVWKSAFAGLLIGALTGALVISSGNPLAALEVIVVEQFLPIFGSTWKLSAVLFTLILGGFVALIEASGGLQTFVQKLLGKGTAQSKRMQLSVVGLGFLVFFDGLANTMLIGRLMRSAADRCGVSREKLAYLADATGSAIACLAFISTWIAFQLSMIQEGFSIAGKPLSSAYSLFFQSLPTNFYCWFTLVLVFVSILRDFNPGPMGKAKAVCDDSDSPVEDDSVQGAPWFVALLPILVLTISVPVGAYVIGADTLWPVGLEKFADAYAAAEGQVPFLLVGSSLLATLVAGAFLLSVRRGSVSKAIPGIFIGGVRELVTPVCILIAAWMLGAAISQLGAAELMAELLAGRLPLAMLPLLVFILGAVVSFSTGTSWGTMGVLMPLAIPVVFELSLSLPETEQLGLVIPIIGAVFSGAVFGDHCSPFSDTTVVASLASGVEPMDHVRTQLPFALIAAMVAGLCGFLPYGLGVPAWVCLLLGTACLVLISCVSTGQSDT